MKTEYSLAEHPRRTRSRGDTEVAMTPMIDVIFLLLVFFLATSSFQAVEKLLPSGVSTPSSATGSSTAESPPEPSQEAIEQVVVRIGFENQQVRASVNGVALDRFELLKDQLASIRRAQADVPVIIAPDENVPMQRVVQAYDWARQAGLLRVFLATEGNR